MPSLESPFFCPEFTVAVSQATDNVFVGILHGSAGQAAALAISRWCGPTTERTWRCAITKGVIAPAGLEFNAKDLVKGCDSKSGRLTI